MSDDELPEGFRWEYEDGQDGGGNIGQGLSGNYRSEIWPATRYKRMVGPWAVDREGGRSHAIITGRLGEG